MVWRRDIHAFNALKSIGSFISQDGVQHLLPREYVVVSDGNHIQVSMCSSIIHNPKFQNSSWLFSDGCEQTHLICYCSLKSIFIIICGLLDVIFHHYDKNNSDCELQMEDGRIAHIQYEHDGTFLQEQQVEPRADYTIFLCYSLYYAAFKLCLNYSNYSTIA